MLLQKSAALKTLSAAFVATFVRSGIFRLRLRQSLRQRCKTSTFATGSNQRANFSPSQKTPFAFRQCAKLHRPDRHAHEAKHADTESGEEAADVPVLSFV